MEQTARGLPQWRAQSKIRTRDTLSQSDLETTNHYARNQKMIILHNANCGLFYPRGPHFVNGVSKIDRARLFGRRNMMFLELLVTSLSQRRVRYILSLRLAPVKQPDSEIKHYRISEGEIKQFIRQMLH